MALIGREAPRPFRRMPYAEAIAKYGSDKPDLRCGMEIAGSVGGVRASPRSASFRDAIARRRRRPRVRRARRRRATRARELDELVEQAKQLGAAGLVWARTAEGAVQSSASRRRARTAIRAGARDRPARAPADLLLMAAGQARRDVAAARRSCGCTIAKKENLLDPTKFEFLWVVDFPLFEWHEDEQRWEFMHHPFTSPLDEDVGMLETDPGRRARRPTTSC